MNKGFTMIEVIVTSIILSFVLLGVGSVLVISQKTADMTFKTYMKRTQLTNAFDLLKNDIRMGSRVEVVAGNSELIIYDDANLEFSRYSKNGKGKLERNYNDGISKMKQILNMNKVKFDWFFSEINNTSANIAMEASYECSDSKGNDKGNDWEQMIIICRNHIK